MVGCGLGEQLCLCSFLVCCWLCLCWHLHSERDLFDVNNVTSLFSSVVEAGL